MSFSTLLSAICFPTRVRSFSWSTDPKKSFKSASTIHWFPASTSRQILVRASAVLRPLRYPKLLGSKTFQRWAPGGWPGPADRLGRKPRVCLEVWSCPVPPFSGSPIFAPLAADRFAPGVRGEVVPDFDPDSPQSPRSSPYRLRLLLDLRERAPTQSLSSRFMIPCPPNNRPLSSNLRTTNYRIGSKKS